VNSKITLIMALVVMPIFICSCSNDDRAATESDVSNAVEDTLKDVKKSTEDFADTSKKVVTENLKKSSDFTKKTAESVASEVSDYAEKGMEKLEESVNY